MRLASYQVALDHLATMQQDFDPRGTSFAAVGSTMQQLAVRHAQTVEAQRKELHAESLADIKEDRERALAASTIEKNRQESALGWAKEAREGVKAKADNTVLSPREIVQQFPDFPVAAIPAGGMTVADATKRAELHNKTLEATNKGVANAMQQAGTQVMGPDGNPLTTDGKAGGKPVLMPTHEQAQKLNEKTAGGQDLITSLGKVRRFLNSDPSSLDRTAYAAATTDFENAKFAYAKLHDTKASSRELEAMESLFGPNFENYSNRFKDKGVAMAHIDALINDAQSTVSNALTREAKYTGPSVIVDTSKPDAVAVTPSDRSVRMLLEDRRHDIGAPGYSHYDPDAGELVDSGVSTEQGIEFERLASDLRGPAPDVQRQLSSDLARQPGDSLRVRAEDAMREAGKRRSAALQQLETVASKAKNPGVREAARQLLTSVIESSVPEPTEQVR